METGRKFYWTRHRRSIWDPFLAALVRCGSAPAELCLGAPGKGEGAGRKANAPPSQAFPVHINIFLDSGSCGYHHARALSWPIDQRQGLRSVDGAKDYQHFRRYPKRGTWSARVDCNNVVAIGGKSRGARHNFALTIDPSQSHKCHVFRLFTPHLLNGNINTSMLLSGRRNDASK